LPILAEIANLKYCDLGGIYLPQKAVKEFHAARARNGYKRCVLSRP
jgi:hypothetical protein